MIILLRRIIVCRIDPLPTINLDETGVSDR